MRAWLGLFFVPALLAACGQQQREARRARLDSLAPGAPLAAASPYLAEAGDQSGEARLVLLGDDTGEGIRAAVAERLRRKPADHEFRLLALSTGGAYGAFGAGVLQGLHELDVQAGKRPQAPWRRFDVVTGASTGAMLAPLAYLGRQADIELMVARYTRLTSEAVYRRRWPFEYLWADSLLDTAPLRRMVEAIVTPRLLEAIGEEWRSERRVLAVLAANADTGNSEVFDLGRLAAGDGKFAGLSAEQRRDRFVRALMASAAIPIGFTPVSIDGCMFFDGGVRQHLFVTSEVALALAEAEGWDVRRGREPRSGQPLVVVRPSGPPSRPVALHLLVNNDLRLARGDTPRALLPVAQRVFSLVVDDGMRSAIDRMRTTARSLGWQVRYTDAYDLTRIQGEPEASPAPTQPPRAVVRGDNDDLFDPAFMSRLHELALMRARVEGDQLWQDPPDTPAPAAVRPGGGRIR